MNPRTFPPAAGRLLLLAALAWPAAPTLAQPAAAPVSKNAQASRLYEDALTRFEKKDYAGAIIQLKNALKIDNKSIAVQALIGKALLFNSEVHAAEVALLEALRLGVDRAEVVVPLAQSVMHQGRPQEVIDSPRLTPGGLPPTVQQQLLLVRAGAHSDLNDPKSALRAIEEARAIDPNLLDTWVAEIPIRVRARQFREATAAADRAQQLAPNSADVAYQHGQVAHAQGDLRTALEHYNRALQIQADHMEALVSRGGLFIDQNRIPDARQDAQQLLKTNPREPRALYLKAMVAEREGNATESRAAMADITGLLDPVPIEFMRYRSQMLMLGGLAHYALGSKEKARPYLEGVQRLQPTSGVSKLLASIYLSEKNYDRAIESLENYLRSSPGDMHALHLLASVHMSQGRHARAAQLMQDALRKADLPDLRATLGLSLMGAGRFGNAVAELEATVKKEPGQLQAASALTSIYLQSGQARRALAVAEGLAKAQGTRSGVQNLLGSARLASGDRDGARAAFDQALKLDPSFAAPSINIARLEADSGQFDVAIARLNAVVGKESKNVEALMVLASIAERRNQLADAQRWLEKADDVAGLENYQSGLALVDFHLRHRKADLAQEATKRLTTKAPEAVPVLIALARVSLARGDNPGARSSLSRAATIANYNAPVLVQVASLQVQAGHLPGAAYTLSKALGERPDYLPAQSLMTEVELRQGETSKAEQRARQIVQQQPKRGVGHALLGDIAGVRGQSSAMVEHYARAHQLDQSTESLLRLYGVMVVSDRAGASRLADRWLKAKPKDVAVHRIVADANLRAGNAAAAKAGYEAVLALRPDDAESLNNLAFAQVQLKDPGALKSAERAMQLRPDTAYIIGTAGWAALQAGQSDRALQLLRDARLRDPANPDTRYFLGVALQRAGRTTEARDEVTAALRGGRSFTHAKEAEELLKALR